MSHLPVMGPVHAPSGTPGPRLHLQENKLEVEVPAALFSGVEPHGERLVLPEDKPHGQRGSL